MKTEFTEIRKIVMDATPGSELQESINESAIKAIKEHTRVELYFDGHCYTIDWPEIIKTIFMTYDNIGKLGD